ncbi:ABC transporter ATP-binding protein [Nemorincola caseinilytica]|uniref:ABC transporter ATP-binding protein n=1 Tax=Nemorincola caseinilytica TaxID=2054315 RepID=A0ABP8NIM2_9BACT
MEPIVEIQNITKVFKKINAVSDLSFSIHKGDVYGFLGQNGAGKSTTMRMLLGLIFPDSGRIIINGQEFNNGKRHLLRHIGAIIERPDMYGYLSGWDNLKIFAALTDRSIPATRLHAVLEQVGLKGREKDKVKTYSYGMKQRLGIAIALVHEPDLLILDEPTNGLDPQGIADIRELIRSLSRDHGKTVLVSSHLLHEIEQVATRMLVLHKGKKIAEGMLSDLLNPNEMLVQVGVIPAGQVQARIAASSWQPMLVGASADQLTFKLHKDNIPELNRWLVMNGVNVTEIRSKHSLEDHFLSLTNDQATATRAI